MRKLIRVSQPFIAEEEIKAVTDVLKSGILALGPKVKAFEEEFAKFIGVKHAIAVSNGTIALELILKGLRISQGDEVIVPDFTFIATASAVMNVGAKPVFADIELDTYTIDVEDVRSKITKKTKAIIAVHLYGHPANLKALKEICEDHKIVLIEDAAQAHGAEIENKKVGSIGFAAAFSFYATKNLTTGEGGMITTNDDKLAKKIRLLRNHGQERKYYHILLGGNYRMSELQAAIGLAQLRKLNLMNSTRSKIASKYLKELSTLTWIKLPKVKPWAKHAWHLFVIWVKDDAPLNRDELHEYLRKKGIETAIHYPKPLHQQPLIRSLKLVKNKCCPNASKASKHVLSLPIHPNLRDEDVNYVIEVLKRVESL